MCSSRQSLNSFDGCNGWSLYFSGKIAPFCNRLKTRINSSRFNPLFKHIVRIVQKLNNDEQIIEQQILNLLNLMLVLTELQPIFKELTVLLQKPQEQQLTYITSTTNSTTTFTTTTRIYRSSISSWPILIKILN